MTAFLASPARPWPRSFAFPTTAVAIAGLSTLIFISHMLYAPQIILNIPWEDAEISPGAGDAGRQALFALVFCALAYALARARGFATLLEIPWPLLMVLLWCWLSVSWAIAPDVSVRRIMFTTLVALSAVYAVQILHYRTVIQVLVGCYIAMLCADLVAVAVFPLAVHVAPTAADTRLDRGLTGDWRGFHEHKNAAGAVCALAAIVLAYETVRLRSYAVGLTCTLIALLFLLKTHSKTSGAFVGVAFAMGAFAHFGYRHPRARDFGLLCAAGLSGLWLGLGGDNQLTQYFTALFDDPASLTGRVQIWPMLLDYAQSHPLLGSGFGSFWDIGSASPIANYGAVWAFHGHNGYLDILVTVGGVGLALTLFTFILRPLYLLFYRPLPNYASRVLLCAAIIFVALHDLLESSLLNRAEPSWVILMIWYALLEKSAAAKEAPP